MNNGAALTAAPFFCLKKHLSYGCSGFPQNDPPRRFSRQFTIFQNALSSCKDHVDTFSLIKVPFTGLKIPSEKQAPGDKNDPAGEAGGGF